MFFSTLEAKIPMLFSRRPASMTSAEKVPGNVGDHFTVLENGDSPVRYLKLRDPEGTSLAVMAI